MCDNCFTNEIESFPDEKTWLSFDFELTKKLGNGTIKNIKSENDGNMDKDGGEYIYQCLTCGELWKLKDPDNAFRGYFLKRSTINKLATPTLDLSGPFKTALIILIIILAIYIFRNWSW